MYHRTLYQQGFFARRIFLITKQKGQWEKLRGKRFNRPRRNTEGSVSRIVGDEAQALGAAAKTGDLW
jgi:hypothetical protein